MKKLEFKRFVMEEFILETVLTYFNWTKLSKFRHTHTFVCYMVVFKKYVYTDFGTLYHMSFDAFKIYVFLM